MKRLQSSLKGTFSSFLFSLQDVRFITVVSNSYNYRALPRKILSRASFKL